MCIAIEAISSINEIVSTIKLINTVIIFSSIRTSKIASSKNFSIDNFRSKAITIRIMLIHINIIRHTINRRIEISIHNQKIRFQTCKNLRRQHHNIFLTNQFNRFQNNKTINQTINKIINKTNTIRSRQLTIDH